MLFNYFKLYVFSQKLLRYNILDFLELFIFGAFLKFSYCTPGASFFLIYLNNLYIEDIIVYNVIGVPLCISN